MFPLRLFSLIWLLGTVLDSISNAGARAADDCHPTCLECYSPGIDQCRTCRPEQNRVHQKYKCVCKDGYFEEMNNPKCVQCHHSCKSCTDPSSTKCIDCLEPRERNSKTDECDCPKIGHFEDPETKKCIECYETCATCTGPWPSQCKECMENRIKKDGNCVCPPGTYSVPNSARCHYCHRNCEECTGGENYLCTKCRPTDNRVLYYESEGSTVGKCVCNHKGFYEDGGFCLRCDPHCQRCIDKGKCHLCTTEDREVVGGMCVCKSGYERPDGTCGECHSDCSKCNGPNADQCQTCPQYRVAAVPMPGKCSCPHGQTGEKCDKVCHHTCVSCSGEGENECKSCNNSRILVGNACKCGEGLLEMKKNETLHCVEPHEVLAEYQSSEYFAMISAIVLAGIVMTIYLCLACKRCRETEEALNSPLIMAQYPKRKMVRVSLQESTLQAIKKV